MTKKKQTRILGAAYSSMDGARPAGRNMHAERRQRCKWPGQGTEGSEEKKQVMELSHLQVTCCLPAGCWPSIKRGTSLQSALHCTDPPGPNRILIEHVLPSLFSIFREAKPLAKRVLDTDQDV